MLTLEKTDTTDGEHGQDGQDGQMVEWKADKTRCEA